MCVKSHDLPCLCLWDCASGNGMKSFPMLSILGTELIDQCFINRNVCISEFSSDKLGKETAPPLRIYDDNIVHLCYYLGWTSECITI